SLRAYFSCLRSPGKPILCVLHGRASFGNRTQCIAELPRKTRCTVRHRVFGVYGSPFTSSTIFGFPIQSCHFFNCGGMLSVIALSGAPIGSVPFFISHPPSLIFLSTTFIMTIWWGMRFHGALPRLRTITPTTTGLHAHHDQKQHHAYPGSFHRI